MSRGKFHPLLPIRKPETLLLFATILLIGIGIVMIYSSSAFFAQKYWKDSSRFMVRHLIYIGVSVFFFRFALQYHYKNYRKTIQVFMILTFILMILVLIPGIGTKVSGARRWIRFLGIGFQPSELLKFSLILWTAGFVDRKRNLLGDFSRGLLPSFIITGMYLFLLLLQPDFGTAVLISLTIFLMIFVAGSKPIHMIVSLIGVAIVFFFLIISSDYRMRRISAFLDPWSDPTDSGYQLVGSLIAYGTGGIFGKGLGNSTQKLLSLPQAHTDFIFSIIAEETGFIGVCVVLALFILLMMAGFRIAKRCKDEFGRNLAFGITTMISLQSFIHICVVNGLLPTKGIGLPLISYGGSSFLMSVFMIGVLTNIERHSKPLKE